VWQPIRRLLQKEPIMGDISGSDPFGARHLIRMCQASADAARERLRRSRETLDRSLVRLQRAEAACVATERALRCVQTEVPPRA